MVPLALRLDSKSTTPLHRQLYEEIRAAVLCGRLSAGARLPSTRALAADLDISRNTVFGAFDQLLAEGYIAARPGAGTFVAKELPEELLRVAPRASTPNGDRAPAPELSRRGQMLASTPVAPRASTANGDLAPAPELSRRGQMLASTPVAPAARDAPVRDLAPAPELSRRGQMLASTPVAPFARDGASACAFRPGTPALDEFPRDLWARIAARQYRQSRFDLFSYGDPAGFPPLRRAIAEYLRAARGVNCCWQQVIVTSGSQQALDLAARVLLDPGDTAWVEDPGYFGARGAWTAAGVRCVAVPVDAEGLSVVQGELSAPRARMAYVSPSHQYPLGVTMSLARRMALLAWARRRSAWIAEDDYDSEFRYAGRPLAALQGLDGAGRVIYLGTFSKVLFPALRLGYMVVPEGIVDAFAAARALADRHPPGPSQALVAEFLAEGHFARHVRRMRTLYAERQAALLSAAREWAGLFDISPADAGMHLVAWLPEGSNDCDVSRLAAEAGVSAPPLSAYYRSTAPRPALLLGYSSVSPRKIQEGARRLTAAMINWHR
jgi:GntR family transcriptional regulator/MocR family aminotransferase